MKRIIVLLVILACSILPLGPAQAYTKAVLSIPVLGASGLADDLYLFSCPDATCAGATQLSEYGHVTNVPRWPKGQGGPGGPPPQIWVFLDLTDGAAQYFQVWQQNGANCWQSCVLAIDAQGNLDTANTTCAGTVYVAPVGSDGVPSFTFGAAMFANATCVAAGPTVSQTNTVPARSLTFVNGSSAAALCLQTDSSFEHPDCSGAQSLDSSSGQTYTITDLVNGSNSGVAQVSGYKTDAGGAWTDTGRGVSANAQVYATNLEWTAWPQHTQHTMGPTTIDISLVNGFNVGASLAPDQDCVCSVADTEGGVPYFVLYKANTPMGQFPNNGIALSGVCPSGSEAPLSQDPKQGCYSSCSQARYNGDADQDQLCCDGSYNTAATCTDPPNQAYVQSVDANSTRVYSWAFNDWRGTFTCQPNTSFTFTVTDIYQ